jgi:Uma2 family endonuclease
MATQPKHFATVEEYLAQEEAALERHEYFRGEVFLMAGGTPTHSIISANALTEINLLLRGSSCRTFDSNQAIRTSPEGLYTYADVVVACADRQFDGNLLLNPVLIVEVLSPTTEAYDRGRKFELYQEIPSFQEYLLIVQDRPSVVRYLRNCEDTAIWTMYTYHEWSTAIPLTSVAIQLTLSDLYRDVSFDR